MFEKFKNFAIKTHLNYLLLAISFYLLKAVLYFGVKAIPNPVYHFHMRIDELIPFIKYFFVFYVTYYFLPIIFLWILSWFNKEKFFQLFFAAVIANVVATIIFAFFQVQMIRPEGYENSGMTFKDVHNISDFFDLCISFQYTADAGALNCFPSLHAAGGTILITLGLPLNKNEKHFPIGCRITCIIFGIGILLSTMFIKQHYFVDVIAGITLYILSFIGSVFIVKAIRKKDSKFDALII